MIICLGTTPAVQKTMLFDRVTTNGVNRANAVAQYASGKSINSARVLHRLGEPVITTGFLGGDAGSFIQRDLDAAGINHRFVTVAPQTRTCITVVDRANGTATELIEESTALPATDYDALLDTLRPLLQTATGLVLSGSLPPGAPTDFYARCISTAPQNVNVVLDAKGDPLQRALSFAPTVVKPNRQELAETVGQPVNSDAELKVAIQSLIKAGPKWVVVTSGAEPTVVSSGQSFWQIAAPKVEVVSPIGSGDSFAAGLMAGITRGMTVPEACRLATACGSANAMTDRAGFLNQADVAELLNRISIREF